MTDTVKIEIPEDIANFLSKESDEDSLDEYVLEILKREISGGSGRPESGGGYPDNGYDDDTIDDGDPYKF